jgi:hypothetical protein
MNAKQLERASYMAAHAILSTNTTAPHLATPGARRTYMVDIIADKIKGVFELHCSALAESAEWSAGVASVRESHTEQDCMESRPQGSADSQKVPLTMQKVH